MTPSPSVRPGLRLLALGLFLLAAQLRATEGGFSATLPVEQQTAAGLSTLTADERAALDRLVAADLHLARHENSAELDRTFVARRTEAERRQAGLDRLPPEQLARLNDLVAAAIAVRPAPKARPRLPGSEVRGAKTRGEIHGSVSVAYGWGRGGRDFRASSLELNYYDPESRIGLGLRIMTSHGGYPGYFYYPDYYASPDDPFSGPYPDAFYRVDSRARFYQDDGTYLRGPVRGDFTGGGFRHR